MERLAAMMKALTFVGREGTRARRERSCKGSAVGRRVGFQSSGSVILLVR